MNCRAQTLVLFALALFLLALMVTMSASIGARVQERVELQTTADAAAYANAVATARTLNAIALLNRAQLSHLAVAAGLQSLVNWSSEYQAHVCAALGAFLSMGNCGGCSPGGPDCCQNAGCRRFGDSDCAGELALAYTGAVKALGNELCRVRRGFAERDRAAATDVLNAMAQARALHAPQAEVLASLRQQLGTQALSNHVAALADPEGRSLARRTVHASTAAADVSLRELDAHEGCAGGGAVCERATERLHAVYAAMGTRGDAFITGRERGAALMNARLAGIPESGARGEMGFPEWLDFAAAPVAAVGATYFFGQVPTHGEEANARFLVADDHGRQSAALSFTAPRDRCVGPDLVPDPELEDGNSARFSGGVVYSQLVSTDHGDGNDRHRTSCGDELDATVTHDLLDCAGDCPSVWPPFADYDAPALDSADDVFGQPKQLVLMERSPGDEPWNLRFRFGTAGRLDLGAQRGGPAVRALSTGLAYYHRWGAPRSPHWREPPNLLNPFWRATLVSADVDAEGSDDVTRVLLGAAAPEAAETWQRLRAIGYRSGR